MVTNLLGVVIPVVIREYNLSLFTADFRETQGRTGFKSQSQRLRQS
jgi:hypothetical protein